MTLHLFRSSGRFNGVYLWSMAAIAMALLACTPGFVIAQRVSEVRLNASERGAELLGSTLDGIGTTGRVLTIGAHPDDEDTPIIAWLARGRHVETAYLSLTRGDGGQNLIGNELGEPLGAIRTQELLAARRIDRGRQFFTRAYDFGFSKNAEETYEHWPKDTVLGDVVRVVRAFRPHVIVAFFSGTPRDGHGHHQVSGLLAREAFDLAADTVRFPVRDFGLPWTPQKFYRSSRQAPGSATLRINTGEYDALLGRSFFEIAAESRSQHKSQGFGMIQRKGVMWAYLSLETSRTTVVGTTAEKSIFDGVDTTWTGLRAGMSASLGAPLDSALATIDGVRRDYRAYDPSPLVTPLASALRQFRLVRDGLGTAPAIEARDGNGGPARIHDRATGGADPALWDALSLAISRTELALLQAAGIAIEATAQRETYAVREAGKHNVSDSLPVAISIYNRGRHVVGVISANVVAAGAVSSGDRAGTEVAPDSVLTLSRHAVARRPDTPWWRSGGRGGRDWFLASIDAQDEVEREAEMATEAHVTLDIAGQAVTATLPVVYRRADPVRGDLQTPVSAVPGISVNLASSVEYIRAGVPIDRIVSVRVQSAYPHEAMVQVRLDLPTGLRADSLERRRILPAEGSAVVTFRLHGALRAGAHRITATAYHENVPAGLGLHPIIYDHITPMRLYDVSAMVYSAVEVALPSGAHVGYITGVADGGLDALRQLDIEAEKIDPSSLDNTDLSRFTSIVVGPRAYEANDELVRQNQRLLDFVDRGGTLVVQYGAQDMSRFSVTPFPLEWTRPAARVTIEQAPVTILQPADPLLVSPNRIGATDWANWVQERATYMPSTIDQRYTALLSMNDPGEPPNHGALLVAPLGRGRYVYVTLALFRQLPSGVPGAARILANLVNGDFPARTPLR